jgi:hypothetical protein
MEAVPLACQVVLELAVEEGQDSLYDAQHIVEVLPLATAERPAGWERIGQCESSRSLPPAGFARFLRKRKEEV